MAEPLIHQTRHLVDHPTRDFWKSSYFPELDGLRTLSFLLVIGYHIRTTLPIKHYFNGVVGVTFFFVLSGFLITTLLLREDRTKGAVALGAFYIRRFFRIIPLYAFTIAVYLIIGSLPSQHVLGHKMMNALPYDLTLRNEYIPVGLDVPFTHSWSLSVEEKFYLIWPLLFLAICRKPRYQWLVMIPLCIAPLLISFSGHVTVGYFGILLGCSLSFLLEGLNRRQEAVCRVIRSVPAVVWLLPWVAAYFLSLDDVWLSLCALTTTLLIPKLLLEQSWLSRLFSTKLLQWMGKRTYSMYLLHAFCLSAVEDHVIHPTTTARYFAVYAVTVLVCMGVGALTYSFVELPLIRVGRRIASNRTARLAPVAAAGVV